MSLSNTGRIFLNGDIYKTIDEKTRLANMERELVAEGIAQMRKHLERMEEILNAKPKKKGGRKKKGAK